MAVPAIWKRQTLKFLRSNLLVRKFRKNKISADLIKDEMQRLSCPQVIGKVQIGGFAAKNEGGSLELYPSYRPKKGSIQKNAFS